MVLVLGAVVVAIASIISAFAFPLCGLAALFQFPFGFHASLLGVQLEAVAGRYWNECRPLTSERQAAPPLPP